LFVEEMQWRGLVKQLSHDTLADLMRGERLTLYSGFDPTARSLHVGNLMPIMGLRRAQLHGHHPIALVGGATGMIGDPSGKSSERNLLTAEVLAANLAGLEAQLSRFLDFEDASLVNNGDWIGPMTYLEMLRDVGKHFSVNAMIAKDSVKTRLEEREHGISYTEFSYMLIQAYDFYHLYKERGCRLQIGGSEQWGNITAGIDLTRRLAGVEVYGMTLPLLLDATGKKFGKSEAGAVWLDAELTSPYDFYQYFVRVDDRDVPKVLRYLTTLDRATIEGLEAAHAEAPQKREAHRALARFMTALVHGEAEAIKAEAAAQALFSHQAGALPPGTPTHDFAEGKLASGWLLVDALVESGLLPSKGAARREIQGGGIYVNEQRIGSPEHSLGVADLQDGMIRLRKGKKSHMVLKPA
jgi:tyrosyl-tRNA synthetase